MHQQNAYPEFDDIRENYFIDSQGSVYEGRGLAREGQTTYESLTSYNNKAISISFLLEENSKPTELQEKSLCWLIENLNLTDYKLYKQSDLTTRSSDDDYKFQNCSLVWKKRKTNLR